MRDIFLKSPISHAHDCSALIIQETRHIANCQEYGGSFPFVDRTQRCHVRWILRWFVLAACAPRARLMRRTASYGGGTGFNQRCLPVRLMSKTVPIWRELFFRLTIALVGWGRLPERVVCWRHCSMEMSSSRLLMFRKLRLRIKSSRLKFRKFSYRVIQSQNIKKIIEFAF